MTKAIKEKDLQYYVNLPYTVTLRKDEDGDFVAKIVELEGCSAHGADAAEALANLDEAKSLWIEDALESGERIPLPEDDTHLPSGKWLQRVPRSLHKKLVARAAREGVSLNQLVTSLLAECVGLGAGADPSR
jgi:antitoxin HicB